MITSIGIRPSEQARYALYSDGQVKASGFSVNFVSWAIRSNGGAGDYIMQEQSWIDNSTPEDEIFWQEVCDLL